MVIESTQASDQAKAAVHQNSRLLQEKIAEKSKLLSQLDQAKMQEEMNSAMAQLNESVGADVPTLAEVQEKIQARYAKAKATAELDRGVGRVTGARGRAGDGQRRGPGPPQRAARRARPRRRRAGARRRAAGDRRATPRLIALVPNGWSPRLLAGLAQPGSITRSSRWMTSWAMPGGRSLV